MVLKIGALSIPAIAALQIEQKYDDLDPESIFRTVDGTGIKQTTWKKKRVSTTGSGWLPTGLDTLDTASQLILSCIVPRSVPANFATRQATLPATRRSDSGHTPWGIAIDVHGRATKTTVSLAGDVATVYPVSGAVAYLAAYLPELTVWAFRPTETGNSGDASYQWELLCEEV